MEILLAERLSKITVKERGGWQIRKSALKGESVRNTETQLWRG